MDSLLQMAPDGVSDSLMSLCVPMVAAGVGLVLICHLVGLVWSVVLSVFEL